MIELIDLVLWEAQLKTQCPAFENRIYKTIPDSEPFIYEYKTPLAFLYTAGDKSGDYGQSNKRTARQKNTANIAVEIIVRRNPSAADRLDMGLGELLRAYRTEVLNALLGWEPGDSKNPVIHVSGELKKRDKGAVHWVDTFSNEKLLIKTL